MTSPSRMTLAKADALYQVAVHLHADNEDENEEITVYEGSVTLPELDLDAGPVVVAGDLDVTGDILGMSEDDGYLVVLGSCKARNVLLGGPEVVITKDLVAENGVLADYNHGSLTVGGDLVAKVLCAEHLVRVGGSVIGSSVDFGGLKVASPGFAPTVSRQQALRESAALFTPEVLGDDGSISGRRLHDLMRAGKPILRR